MSPKEYFIRRWRRSQSSLTDSPAATENGVVIDDRETPLSFRELLIAPVLVATGSYASFTILDISFRTVLPVYLATPLEMGGLGLDPPAIGTILATMEVAGGVLQLLLFAPLHRRLGGKAIFLTTMSLFFPIAALFPITNRMAQEHGLNGFVWFLVGLQIFLFACASLAICKPFLTISWARDADRTFCCFRRHLYLYQCCCAEPRFGWSDDWPRTVTGVYHVGGWPIGHQLGFCIGHPKACHGRLFCILGDGGDGDHCCGHWRRSSERCLRRLRFDDGGLLPCMRFGGWLQNVSITL